MTVSTAQLIGAIAVFGVVVVVLAGWARGIVRGLQSGRRIRAQARQREALRQPQPNTLVVEGEVVGEPMIAAHHQHGCLGGPLLHEVPPFELALDDGTRHTIVVGGDPRVENIERLTPIPTAPGPRVTGAGTWVTLRGRVRVAGVERRGDQLAPPDGHSATLVVLR